MRKFIFLLILASLAQTSFAVEPICTKLSKQVDSVDDNYRPPL